MCDNDKYIYILERERERERNREGEGERERKGPVIKAYIGAAKGIRGCMAPLRKAASGRQTSWLTHPSARWSTGPGYALLSDEVGKH